jgi:hypothetical protein
MAATGMEAKPLFDVFISYHSGDAGRVGEIKSALSQKGLKVWIDSDQIKPGDVFAEAIENGLAESRAVALIVSAGSMRSDWVKEEYYRALGLANASSRRLRLIPVVIDSTPLPGFLASRSWADFRDAARFAQSVEHLYRGITADQNNGVNPEPDQAAHPQEPERTSAFDEFVYLERALSREAKTVTKAQTVRALAPFAGLGVGGALSITITLAELVHPAVWVVGTAAVTSLIGYGATARQLAISKPNVERLTCLKDGLELCRRKNEQGCSRLWSHFWRVVHQQAGLDSA